MSDRTVIALGFFDGVHLGHAALLRCAAQRAKELGCTAAAFTFDPAPREVVTGVAVPLLTDAQERSELMRGRFGIGWVIVAPFDREMMTMPWETFLSEVLVRRCGAVHLVAGHDFRFGHRNEGTAALLQAYCAAHGLGCDIIGEVKLDGVTVSSTHIRALVEAGEVETANAFLGHPYALGGTVCHGRGIGHERLFPTANLAPGEKRLLPARGVYITRAVLAEGSFPAVTNVGLCPTVRDGGGQSVETYLLAGGGDLYGKEMRVEFCRRIRGERQFDAVEQLHAQIAADARAAQRYWEEQK